MAKERIGFMGAGLMGHGMAKNIVMKGYPLMVMGHRNRKPIDDLLSRGATEGKSAAEIARQSASLGFTPAAIVFCSGSGATQAGLALDRYAAGDQILDVAIYGALGHLERFAEIPGARQILAAHVLDDSVC